VLRGGGDGYGGGTFLGFCWAGETTVRGRGGERKRGTTMYDTYTNHIKFSDHISEINATAHIALSETTV